jgi:hypothetical protein
MAAHDVLGTTIASASRKMRTNPRANATAAGLYPEFKCICPQHVCANGKATLWPSRSNTRTTAWPVRGKKVSLKQVMKRETRIGVCYRRQGKARKEAVLFLKKKNQKDFY